MTSFNFKSSGNKLGDREIQPKITKKDRDIGIKTPLTNYQGRQLFDMHTDPVAQIKDNLKNLILTNAGERLGHFLISGSIFIRGKWKSLGHNTKITELTSDDIIFLQQLLSTYKINANPENFTKITPETDKPFYSKK